MEKYLEIIKYLLEMNGISKDEVKYLNNVLDMIEDIVRLNIFERVLLDKDNKSKMIVLISDKIKEIEDGIDRREKYLGIGFESHKDEKLLQVLENIKESFLRDDLGNWFRKFLCKYDLLTITHDNLAIMGVIVSRLHDGKLLGKDIYSSYSEFNMVSFDKKKLVIYSEKIIDELLNLFGNKNLLGVDRFKFNEEILKDLLLENGFMFDSDVELSCLYRIVDVVLFKMGRNLYGDLCKNIKVGEIVSLCSYRLLLECNKINFDVVKAIIDRDELERLIESYSFLVATYIDGYNKFCLDSLEQIIRLETKVNCFDVLEERYNESMRINCEVISNEFFKVLEDIVIKQEQEKLEDELYLTYKKFYKGKRLLRQFK